MGNKTTVGLIVSIIMTVLLAVFGDFDHLSDFDHPSDVYREVIETFRFIGSRDEGEVTPELRPIVANLIEKTETGALSWTPKRNAWEATYGCCAIAVELNRELWANLNVSHISGDLRRDVNTGDLKLGFISQDLVDLLESRFPRKMPERSEYYGLALECLQRCQ